MVDWLCVPLTHRLVARNWNLAMSGLPLTASRVAKSVAVSTPLRTGFSMIVIGGCSLALVVSLFWRRLGALRREAHRRAVAPAARSAVVPALRPRRRRYGRALASAWRRDGERVESRR